MRVTSTSYIAYSIFLLIFLRFLAEIDVCLFFVYIVNMSKISRACLHYDVIVTDSRPYFYWYQWKEESHSYTLVYKY